MNYNNIVLEVNDGIATITINRPSKLNALNTETIKELHEAFNHANKIFPQFYFNIIYKLYYS